MNAPIPMEILSQIDSLLSTTSLQQAINTIQTEKTQINAQLKTQSDNRLEDLDTMMNSIQETNAELQDLKTYVNQLDELAASTNSTTPNNKNLRGGINEIFEESMVVMNNINSVEKIITQMRSFNRDHDMINDMLDRELNVFHVDDENGDALTQADGNGVLLIHYHLTQLMDFNDQLKVRDSNISKSQQMTQNISSKLENLKLKFDDLLELIMDNIYELYLLGNYQYLIKTFKVIEYEEKEDLKFSIWQNLNSTSSNENVKMNRSNRRGYKEKCLQLIKLTIQDKIESIKGEETDPFKACSLVVSRMLNEKDPICQSYYDILSVYRQAIRKCCPPHWKLFGEILNWCQMVIREVIVKVIESKVFNDDLIGKIIHLNLDNRTRLIKMGIPTPIAKSVSFLPDDKKKIILTDRLNTRMQDLQSHVNNLLKRDMNNFHQLCSRGQIGQDGQETRLNVSMPIVNLLKSHFGLIDQLHDEFISIEFLNYFGNEILKIYCTSWGNLITETFQKFINGGESELSYFPEQLSNLSVYFSKLADELEVIFQINQLDGKAIELGNLNQCIFVNEESKNRIEEICEICIKNSIDITIDCLNVYAKVTIHDVDTLFNEIFTKKWYSDGIYIEKILKLISENSFEPFKASVSQLSQSPEEVMHGLIDKFVDELILRYLYSLNSREKVLAGIEKAIGRDINKMANFVHYYSQDNEDDEDDETAKLLVLEYLQTMMTNSNYEQMWVEIVESIPNMPLDLLRLVLECKREKGVDAIIKSCEAVSNGGAGSSKSTFEFLNRFIYKGPSK